MSLKIRNASGTGISLAEARVLLCCLLECPVAYIYAHGDDELNSFIATKFFEQVKMRSTGVPLQHITGKQEFMSLDFYVNEHVLIPRQETEILVEAIINEFLDAGRQIDIFEICTGSGCIAVSLLHYLKNINVTASDISEEALKVAEKNALKHGVEGKIKFVCSNLFDRINGKFNAIVANPPYIPEADIESLSVEVRDFEPSIALDGGEDGLDFYRKIVNGAPGFLLCGGMLAFETGFDQAYAVADLMSSKFNKVRIIKDLSGIGRVVTGYLN